MVSAEDDVDAGLSCRIRGDWFEADAARLAPALNRTFAATKRGRQRSDVGVQLAASVYRLDATTRGKDQREVSAICYTTGELLWLDHHLRLFAKTDPERLPPKRLTSSMRVRTAPALAEDHRRRQLLSDTKDAPDSAVVVTTTIRDGRTHADWQHYLVCDPAQRVAPRVLRTLLTVLLGEPELQALAGFPWEVVHDLVADAGLPVAGGMLLPAAPADQQRRSNFRLEGMEFGPVPEDRFMIPDGYSSARDFRDDDPQGGSTSLNIDFHRPNGRPTPEDIVPGGGPTVPSPPVPAGQASIIGLWIPQTALDAIRSTFNQAVRPLTGFHVGNGVVTFDWLKQLRDHWLDKRGVGGTLLYCALRDEPLPAVGDPTPARCLAFTGRGHLEHMAEQLAIRLVTSGTLPAGVIAALPPPIATNLTNAGTNWAALNPLAQSRIACEVLWQLIGTPELTFSLGATSPTGTIVVESEFAKITIDQVHGQLTLPDVERTATGTIIESRPVIKNLYCRGDAYVVAELNLGTLHLDARCAVEPTEKYWEAVALAHLAAVFFPPLTALSTHAATVGLELLAGGADSITLDLLDGKIFAYVTLLQDASGMFGPVLSFSINGVLKIRSAPLSVGSLAGLLEFLEGALQGWYTNLAFNALAEELTNRLLGGLRQVFGAGFPAAVARVGIPIVGGSRKAAANDHVYFEVELGTIPGGQPRRTIPVNPYQALKASVGALQAARLGVHCVSLNLSENAFNDILVARGRAGVNPPLVHTMVTPQELAPLAGLAQPPADPSHFGFAFLEPASPPRVTLLSTPDPYAMVEAELRFTALAQDPINGGAIVPGCIWTFRVSGEAQIAIGSAQAAPGASPTPIVDWREFPQHVCELLLDLNTSTINLLSLGVIPPAGALQQVQVTPALATQHEPLLRAVLQHGCLVHGFQREPRRDGIGAPTGNVGRTDLPLGQTYTPDGSDPDVAGGAPPAEFPVQLGLSPGLLHMHGQLGGMLSMLVDGTRPLGAADSDCALGRQFLRP